MDIFLKNDIEVEIKELHQWGTYNGLLEGIPTERTNKRIIERTIKRAQEMCYMNEYYLIEPEQTLIEITKPYKFGIPMSLPSIICIAELWHNKPARDMKKHASSLLLIWFQKEYCFPIDNMIIEKFKTVDWTKYALDFEY